MRKTDPLEKSPTIEQTPEDVVETIEMAHKLRMDGHYEAARGLVASLVLVRVVREEE